MKMPRTRGRHSGADGMTVCAMGLALLCTVSIAGCAGGGGGTSDGCGCADVVELRAGTDLTGELPPETVLPEGPVVETASGAVVGVEEEGYRVFRGIPFAKAPVGELRWAPPEAVEPWAGVRDATEFGAVCPQASAFAWVQVQDADEDCLNANVWTPPEAGGALEGPTGAPVMVWIHGGGFMFGAGHLPTYWGHELAKKGVVLVTFNYRVGPLGFLAHPAIGGGNWGLMDQQAALRWVQDNISEFGGDPDNVTIFGESAGGVSVCTHLIMTGAEGLFHRAIMESGVCGIADTPAQAATLGGQLAAAVGCADAVDAAACLRAVPADALVGALPMAKALFFGGGVKWGPALDGALITGQPAVQMFLGQGVRVPTIIGANKDEGTLFVEWAGGGMDPAALEGLIGGFAGDRLDEVLAAYPAEDYASVDARAADILGDATFVCTAKMAARLLATGGTPTWMYHFTREVETTIFPGLGAFHTAELPFVFGNGLYEFDATLPGDAQPLVDEIQGYWTRFAAAGDPNGDGAPEWPGYTPADEMYLELNIPTATGFNLKGEKCALWESIYMGGI
jgi:para-nitrobenzyl esterase